ncbi:hypothetical protein FB45DRAFT_997152 [Roridomyces roridus]|uniref:Uncharacterized protein n=1 Tax=Roridomyces roridus TaxID=1738132 RepID=A0AAD7CIC3_9AGAR|nr:hypothetical protein FB45DRAFT_997152 [Roridomyces roridus]
MSHIRAQLSNPSPPSATLHLRCSSFSRTSVALLPLPALASHLGDEHRTLRVGEDDAHGLGVFVQKRLGLGTLRTTAMIFEGLRGSVLHPTPPKRSTGEGSNIGVLGQALWDAGTASEAAQQWQDGTEERSERSWRPVGRKRRGRKKAQGREDVLEVRMRRRRARQPERGAGGGGTEVVPWYSTEGRGGAAACQSVDDGGDSWQEGASQSGTVDPRLRRHDLLGTLRVNKLSYLPGPEGNDALPAGSRARVVVDGGEGGVLLADNALSAGARARVIVDGRENDDDVLDFGGDGGESVHGCRGNGARMWWVGDWFEGEPGVWCWSRRAFIPRSSTTSTPNKDKIDVQMEGREATSNARSRHASQLAAAWFAFFGFPLGPVRRIVAVASQDNQKPSTKHNPTGKSRERKIRERGLEEQDNSARSLGPHQMSTQERKFVQGESGKRSES